MHSPAVSPSCSGALSPSASDAEDGAVTYQSILGPLLVEMWHSQLGIATVSGNVDTWTGQILGTVVQAPGAANRPVYAADSTDFIGKSVVKFDGVDDSLQIVAMGTPLMNVARPGWILVLRYRNAAGTQNTALSVLDNPVTATIPQIFRQTTGTLNVLYSGTSQTIGAALNNGVHLAEGYIRASDSKVCVALDGVVTAGATAVISKAVSSVYFGNDRGSNHAQVSLAAVFALNDDASLAQRSAVLALARSEWGF